MRLGFLCSSLRAPNDCRTAAPDYEHFLSVAILFLLSQFSGNGEKYPDTTAIAMDDVNKRVSEQA